MTGIHRALAAAGLIVLAGCASTGGSRTTASDSAATSVSVGATTGPKEITTASGLKYQDLKIGDGQLAERGMVVSVHYTGWMPDGTKLDSSLDRGTPYDFQLGVSQVIQGWHEGIAGMRVGGKRKLTIPSSLAYGERGRPPVPPNATLVFDVELVAIK